MCSHRSVYVLQLQGGTFYVGQCDPGRNARAMYVLHMCHPTPWLAKHYPVGIVASELSGDVDAVTVRYMKRYGVDNVRGGSLDTPVLSEQQRRRIRLLDSPRRCTII